MVEGGGGHGGDRGAVIDNLTKNAGAHKYKGDYFSDFLLAFILNTSPSEKGLL